MLHALHASTTDGDLTLDLMDAEVDSTEALTVLDASTIDARRTIPAEAHTSETEDVRRTDPPEAHTAPVVSGEAKTNA